MSLPLHEKRFARARWIWPEGRSWDMYNCFAQFRHAFEVGVVPRRAPLFITADQSYHLYVNGQFAGRGPARGFQSHWPYDEIDLARWLVPGRNVLAIRAHNPGVSNFQYVSAGVAGLLVAAEWAGIQIDSDGTWKCRRQAGVSKNAIPAGLQLFPQEHLDARIEPQDWMAPAFDDRDWPTPWGGGAAWNAMPWPALEERGIPTLREETLRPVRLVGTAAGACKAGYVAARDVTLLRSEEPLVHRRVDQPWQPVRIPATGRRRFRSYLLDFGRTVVGNLTVRLKQTRGGEIVDFWHVESVEADSLRPVYEIPTWNRTALGNRLICRPHRTAHTFYQVFGFRYVLVTIRDSRGVLDLDLELHWVGYPLEGQGNFESSDPTLTAIWKMSRWTQQCCSLDAYVDTPWREQAQWWGDARVQAWNTFQLVDDARLFRRGIASIASQTTPSGLTYGHAPTMAHSCILPDFTLIWLITLWDHYWQTGSCEAFLDHLPTVERALHYFASQTDPQTQLLRHDPRYWLFLDWAPVNKRGSSSIYNLWYLLALDRIAELYRRTGRRAPALRLARRARAIRAALKKLRGRGSLLCEGLDDDGRRVETYSIHAQTLALTCQLFPRAWSQIARNHLLRWIRGEKTALVPPSIYWATYGFSALIEQGDGRQVAAFIRKHWAPMIAHGTTWEQYRPIPGKTSLSHAWSAHPLYHLPAILGGIRQTRAAWAEVEFRPYFIGTRAETAFPTPQGTIQSRWQRLDRHTVEVSLDLPPGVSALVRLPGRRTRRVAGAGWQWIVRDRSPTGKS